MLSSLLAASTAEEQPPLPWILAHPFVGIAALASAAAGLVHAAAAGSHGGDRTLSMVFAATAAAQLGWAFAFAAKPGRWLAAGGLVLNGVFALAWALSRTVGLPVPEALRQVEHVSMQDGVAVVLGIIAAVLAGVATWRHQQTMIEHRSPRLAVGVAGGAILLAAISGMSASHGHGGATVAPTGESPSHEMPAGSDMQDMDH